MLPPLTVCYHSAAAIRFKPSPFLAHEQTLTEITSPSEVRTNQDRGTASINFNVTAEQRSAMSAGTHNIRLYCTSGQFWSTALSVMQTHPCPIEFPPVVEVRVNGTAITNANTRGMKKKPGTAPPLDLTKLCRAGPNQLNLTYINNTSPFTPKVSIWESSFTTHSD